MPETPPEEPHFFEQRLSFVLAMLESTVSEVRSVLDHLREEDDDDLPVEPEPPAA
jgi:hypothetical protein